MSDKIAVITGAGKGIGRATALRFAEAGFDLALFTRTEADYDSLRPQLEKAKVSFLTYSGDIADQATVADFAERTLERFDRVDYVVNNAGVYLKVDLKDSKVEDFDRVMAVNLRGSYLMARAFVGRMVEQGDGVMLFVSSLAGLNGFPGGSIYCASKFAMQGLAESLMLEVRKQGVRVCTVCPGNVRTNMWESEPEPRPLSETIIQPEDVAESIYHACTMPANSMVAQIQMRSTNMRMPE